MSNPDFVDLAVENLANLELPDETELIITLDHNKMTERMFPDLPKFCKTQVHHVSNGFRPSSGNISAIRDRISNVRNESRELVGKSDFVFSFEQDTVLPKNALKKLLDDYSDLSREREVGLVSGIQVGRHGRRILGAWRVDNYQFPQELFTLGMDEPTISEVDGTGFYCYLTPTKLYKSATYGWNEPVGPDVHYGLWLRTKGYHNYVDQSVVCPHRVGDRDLIPDHNVRKIRFYKKKHRWLNEIVK